MTEPDVDAPPVRLRLDVAYDGTAFHGWARQRGLRTVQGEIETALTTALRLPEAVRLVCAGRTDAGVHARGQVAHADVPLAAYEAAEPRRLVRRLAGLLPDDVRVRSARVAPEGFDARWSARSRTYTYRVSDQPGGADPLTRSHVLWHAGHRGAPLDLEALNQAAAHLLGEHDFAAFCRRRDGASTVRTLLELHWDREPGSGLVVMTVRADAFCHSMVRALVGALLPVGDGRRDVQWAARILARRERDPDADVAAPQGLCLEAVEYPPDDDLAGQAERSKRFRGD
ncbi:MAG TPA: tRNA pseudouridine(38-40) synthase TruA [Candidatus Nanopelagicales bacterium]|nr:tRNA pseudouridine(38-40) synthase TruA [Candidatus Nanopelagicales bacterium]